MADRIEQLRKCHGLSQEQLGLALDCSRQAVSKWESNQSKPDVDTIIKMCELFQVSADWLLRGVEPAEQAVQEPAPQRRVLDRLDRRFILGLVMIGLGDLGFLIFYFQSRDTLYMDYGRGVWAYVAFYDLWLPALALLALIGWGAYWVFRWLRRWLAKN